MMSNFTWICYIKSFSLQENLSGKKSFLPAYLKWYTTILTDDDMSSWPKLFQRLARMTVKTESLC